KDLLDRVQNAQVMVLAIIDGVDEIIGDQKVARFLNWGNSTVKGLSGRLRVALFTRPLGLDPISTKTDQFVPFLLLPFDAERRRDLVRRIYSCFGQDMGQADRFAASVDTLPLASLLDNPAILTMLAIV